VKSVKGKPNFLYLTDISINEIDNKENLKTKRNCRQTPQTRLTLKQLVVSPIVVLTGFCPAAMILEKSY
jgi:hypothetical protein